MTLTEAFLQRTGCSSARELKDLPTEMRKRLVVSVDKLEPSRISLQDWNNLILAFGGAPEAAQDEAKRILILLLLRSSPQAKTTEKLAVKQKTEKEPSVLRKVWNGVTTVVVAAVVLLAILLVGVRLAGFNEQA